MGLKRSGEHDRTRTRGCTRLRTPAAWFFAGTRNPSQRSCADFGLFLEIQLGFGTVVCRPLSEGPNNREEFVPRDTNTRGSPSSATATRHKVLCPCLIAIL